MSGKQEGLHPVVLRALHVQGVPGEGARKEVPDMQDTVHRTEHEALLAAINRRVTIVGSRGGTQLHSNGEDRTLT
jgi:hypothetical protein